MTETIKEIIVFVAPLVAGFITSVLIPVIVEKVSVKHLKKKVDSVNEATQFKEIKKELSEIKKEILEMRGKRK